MNAKTLLLPGCLSALIFVSGCAGVGQQVQAGAPRFRPADQMMLWLIFAALRNKTLIM